MNHSEYSLSLVLVLWVSCATHKGVKLHYGPAREPLTPSALSQLSALSQ